MNKFIYGLCLLIAISANWNGYAHTKPLEETQYKALLENTGPGHMWLAPDQQWLVMGDTEKYQAQQDLEPRRYFFAAGIALHRQRAVEKDTPEFSELQ